METTSMYTVDVSGVTLLPQNSKLTEARLKVMEAVPYLKKRAGGALGYSYAGEADLIQKLRPAMLANGLACHPCRITDRVRTEYETSHGKKMLEVSANVTYKFVHTSGEFEEVEVASQAASNADKAAGLMMTYAEKYALRQFFLIETGDDPDEVVAERYSVNSQNVQKAMELIAKAKVPEDLDGLLDRVMAADKSVFDSSQVARLEKAITSKRVALTAKKK